MKRSRCAASSSPSLAIYASRMLILLARSSSLVWPKGPKTVSSVCRAFLARLPDGEARDPWPHRQGQKRPDQLGQTDRSGRIICAKSSQPHRLKPPETRIPGKRNCSYRSIRASRRTLNGAAISLAHLAPGQVNSTPASGTRSDVRFAGSANVRHGHLLVCVQRLGGQNSWVIWRDGFAPAQAATSAGSG